MAESGLGEELAWRVAGALGGGGGDGVVPLKVRPPKVRYRKAADCCCWAVKSRSAGR